MFRVLLWCLTLLLISQSIKCQVIEKKIQDAWNTIDSMVTESFDSEFGVLPAPVYNRSWGVGIAVVPFWIYRLPNSDTENFPSVTQGMIYSNFSDSFVGGIKQTMYFKKNKYWLDTYLGYTSILFEPKNSEQASEQLNFDGFVSNIIFSYSLMNSFYVGVIMGNNYMKETIYSKDYQGGDDYDWYNSIGVKLTYDTRIDIFYPLNSWQVDLSWVSS
ncbi:MAG: hypothetical protein MI866_08825, partial [Bacteroidales bacterium]|nr:hypothetical protein [Bacteroidales bacterium]